MHTACGVAGTQGNSMKTAMTVALFASLLVTSAAISGCASEFDGDEVAPRSWASIRRAPRT